MSLTRPVLAEGPPCRIRLLLCRGARFCKVYCYSILGVFIRVRSDP